MLRVLELTAIICLCNVLVLPSMAVRISSSDTTFSTDTKVTTSATIDTTNEVIESDNEEQGRYYHEDHYHDHPHHHPAEHKKPYVLEEFNRQYFDGSYEYKYILSNGVSRYEKSYWKLGGKGKKLLARKGFYSHPLPNHKYLTVFYTADEHGYQQDISKYTKTIPTLPKYLDVRQLEFPHETSTIKITKPTTTATTSTTKTTTTTTTPKPKVTRQTTRSMPKVTTTIQPPLENPSEYKWMY